jgi:chemotaxis signal transduction protein
MIATKLIPDDKKSIEILKQRAHLTATRKYTTNKEINLDSYVVIKMNEKDYYGIPFEFINEIIINTNITLLPYVPNSIGGVINWRGKLVTIIYLNNLFNLKSSNNNNNNIIVINFNNIVVGLKVDSIEGSNSFDTSTIEPPLNSANMIKPGFIRGLHKGYISILNIPEIINETSSTTLI